MNDTVTSQLYCPIQTSEIEVSSSLDTAYMVYLVIYYTAILISVVTYWNVAVSHHPIFARFQKFKKKKKKKQFMILFSQKNQILFFLSTVKYSFRHWPWNGLTWRVAGRENVFFLLFFLIERNKQKTIDELYKPKNLTLVKMCNLSNKSTTTNKKKKKKNNF